MIADRLRAVEDLRARALGDLEQPRGRHVLHVERRVLAHHDRVEARELARRVLRGEPRFAVQVRRIADDLEAPHVRLHPAVDPGEVLRLAGVERVAAPRGLGHHRVGRVFVDLEPLERIGDEKNVHVVPAAPSKRRRLSVMRKMCAKVPRRKSGRQRGCKGRLHHT
jgi:hypothetical protein